MSLKLEDCQLISYYDLMSITGGESPKFEGQTRIDKDNMYYMCWSWDGKFYKTHNKL
jgi:hypothetical protein